MLPIPCDERQYLGPYKKGAIHPAEIEMTSNNSVSLTTQKAGTSLAFLKWLKKHYPMLEYQGGVIVQVNELNLPQ